MEFLEAIKKKLKPETSILADVTKTIKSTNSSLKKHKIKATCVAGGSIAKGTFIRGDFDADLFVKFDYSYKDQNISDILDKIISYKHERLHGSRDYFQFTKDNLNYELVPVLDIRKPEQSLNVTDMSPWHVDWVKKHIKKGQEDEIRLAKQFCKAAEVYGAESYINGFSGHVLDILIIHYGAFLNLLKATSKWKPKVIIDPEHHYKTSRDILFNINQSKIEGPMIIVDPILKTRNAASALSHEKFALFRKKAVLFLKNPSDAFFIIQKVDKTYLRKKYKKNLFIITGKATKGKDDVVGSKIVKAYKFLKAELKN
jgi:tRNA nucleotidyltransferase (CCA-adding enzyme)